MDSGMRPKNSGFRIYKGVLYSNKHGFKVFMGIGMGFVEKPYFIPETRSLTRYECLKIPMYILRFLFNI